MAPISCQIIWGWARVTAVGGLGQEMDFSHRVAWPPRPPHPRPVQHLQLRLGLLGGDCLALYCHQLLLQRLQCKPTASSQVQQHIVHIHAVQDVFAELLLHHLILGRHSPWTMRGWAWGCEPVVIHTLGQGLVFPLPATYIYRAVAQS